MGSAGSVNPESIASGQLADIAEKAGKSRCVVQLIRDNDIDARTALELVDDEETLKEITAGSRLDLVKARAAAKEWQENCVPSENHTSGDDDKVRIKQLEEENRALKQAMVATDDVAEMAEKDAATDDAVQNGRTDIPAVPIDELMKAGEGFSVEHFRELCQARAAAGAQAAELEAGMRHMLQSATKKKIGWLLTDASRRPNASTCPIKTCSQPRMPSKRDGTKSFAWARSTQHLILSLLHCRMGARS